jgi:glycosyltransferase involved in cell wall biosynthesis
VVATAVGGLPEVIAHEERGLLVPAGDVRAMAIALARLVQSPALRLRLGEQAARHARKHFALDVVVNTYLEWFDTVRRATLSARKIA